MKLGILKPRHDEFKHQKTYLNRGSLETMLYYSIIFLLISRSILVKGGSENLEGHILGGTHSKISEYPHSVFLSITCDKNYVCGGSILTQNFVLTAAHCLETCVGLPGDTVVIKTGHENRIMMKRLAMTDFAIHKEYNTDTLVNDIALVFSNKPIALGYTAKRVVLPHGTPEGINWAYVAGWGLMNAKGMGSDILLSVPQQMQPISVCRLIGRRPFGTFCAGPIHSTGNPDQGDSGSALMVDKYIQIGLVSYKVEKFSLVVYTNVSFHRKWIKRTARNMYCYNLHHEKKSIITLNDIYQ